MLRTAQIVGQIPSSNDVCAEGNTNFQSRFFTLELLYGRTVRGPMSIIREMWTNEQPDEQRRDEYRYVTELRNRLTNTWKLAQDNLGNMS